MTWRGLVARSAALLALVFAGSAFAQSYPTRPVTLIVPWPPGGSTDVTLRSLATLAERHLGQRIGIENKPGATGTLGAQTLAQNAKPDGYTIAQMPSSVLRVPYMMKTAFDPATDFAWIIHLTGYTFGVVVRSDSPWKTWRDFI